VPHRAQLTSISAALCSLAVVGTAWAADPIQPPPPQAAPAPPRVIYVEPVQPRVYLPPAYDAPGPRWRNGYRGSGWKIYNGWWYPPQGFTFNNVPPRVAPAAPYNPHTFGYPPDPLVVVPDDGIRYAEPPPAHASRLPGQQLQPRQQFQLAPPPAAQPTFGQRAQIQPVPSPRTSSAPRQSDTQRVQHVNWCLEEYPDSYLVTNNTYQPRGGPRAQCMSPYWPRP